LTTVRVVIIVGALVVIAVFALLRER